MTEKEPETRSQGKKKKLIFFTSLGVLLICGTTLALTTTKKSKEPVQTDSSSHVESKSSTENILPKKSKNRTTTQKETNKADSYLEGAESKNPVYYARNQSQRKVARETYEQEQKKQQLLSVVPPVLQKTDPSTQPNAPVRPVNPVKPVEPVTSVPIIQVANVVVERGTLFNPLDYIQVEDALDSAPRVFVDTTKLNMNQSGTYTLVVNAINKFDHVATPKEMTVTVGTRPTFALSQEKVSVVIGSAFNPSDYISASDEQDGDVTARVVALSNEVNSEKEGDYVVTYSVSNSLGFTSQINLPVSVLNGAPTLVAGEIHHEINQPFLPLEGVTATAFNGEAIQVEESAIKENTVLSSVEGEYYQRFRVSDRFGKESEIVERKVFVENEAPVIHGIEERVLHVHQTITKDDVLKGLTVTDREDDRLNLVNPIEFDETQLETLDSSKEGSHDLTIHVTDSMGKQTTATIVVRVVNDVPVIHGADALEIGVGDTFDLLAGVTATDTEDGVVPVTVTGTVDTTTAGSYPLHYQAKDKDGGFTEVTRIVTVKEKATSGQKVAEIATKYLGVPYVWGGTTPSGFDCSGLVQYVFKEAVGKDLPRVTTEQETVGVDVPLDQLEIGDLLFWGTKGASSHVAIYMGNNEFIHSPTEGDVVKRTSISNWAPDFAKRVL